MPLVLRTRGSFRRYFLDGPVLDAGSPALLEAIREQRFRPIDDSPTTSDSAGWVSPWDPTGFAIREEDIRFGNRLALAIRVDRKRISSALLKIHVQAQERAEKEALGYERLSRQKVQEIRSAVEAELLARALPSVALHQVFFDFDRRLVLLQGTSDRLATQLAELVQRTFERGLTEATAGPLAERLEQDGDRRAYLDRVGPLLLMPAPRRLVVLEPYGGAAAAPAAPAMPATPALPEAAGRRAATAPTVPLYEAPPEDSDELDAPEDTGAGEADTGEGEVEDGEVVDWGAGVYGEEVDR